MLQSFNCFDLRFCPWEVLQYLHHLQMFQDSVTIYSRAVLLTYGSSMKGQNNLSQLGLIFVAKNKGGGKEFSTHIHICLAWNNICKYIFILSMH